VADPAVTLDDLRSQALSGVPIVLDSTFDRAFWGVGAFGGKLTDEQGRFALDPASTADWLTWLLDGRAQSNIQLEPNIETLKNAFTAGKSAYYLGALADATDLRAQLGGNRLGAIVLPEGPRGTGRPLMRVGSMLVNRESDEQQIAAATHFLTYAAGADAQQRLLESGLVAPTNAGVNLTGRTTASVFLAQAQNAQIIDSQLAPPAVANLLRSLFNRVLNQGAPLAESLDQFYRDLANYRGQFPSFVLAPALEQELAARNAPVLDSTTAVTGSLPAAASAPLSAKAPITPTLPVTTGAATP
jgi:ABC-type glycerol-3-phosphate transport system substrate-binding protein